MPRTPLVDTRGITERGGLNHHQRNGAMSCLLHTICRNIIPYPKMMDGGELVLPSGDTLHELSRFSQDTINPDSQVSSAFMTCVSQK